MLPSLLNLIREKSFPGTVKSRRQAARSRQVKLELEYLEKRLSPAAAILFPDGDFTAPGLAAGTFQYGPTGSPWVFNNGGGVASNGSGFTSQNPNAPAGTQVAFLQGYGSMTQSVSFTSGIFLIGFLAAQRSGNQQEVEVLVDGAQVCLVTPSSTQYEPYQSQPFSITTSGMHAVEFLGLNPTGGDNTALLDQVVSTNIGNSFVRNAEGNISLVYNGSLCSISAPLYQALSYPAYLQLNDTQYNAIPIGVQVTSFAAVNSGNQVFALLSNGDLIYWNAGSWSGSPLGPVASFAVVGNGNQVFALQKNGDLSYFNGGSWSTGVHNVAWFAPANSGANVLVAHTDGSLSYYTVSNNTWASANNTFVRNAEGTIALIYNGLLCSIPATLYQALGNPPYAQLTDTDFNAIPTGAQVSSYAAINGGANEFVLLSNGDLIFWNAGSWSLSLQNVNWFAVGNSTAIAQQNGVLTYFNGNTWASANNTFVRNAEGAIALIYNGLLCSIPVPLYQALGSPPYANLTDSHFNSLPPGPQVSSFAAVNSGNQVFALLSNGDLIYWNAGSWSGSPLGPVASFAVVGNGNQVFALQKNGDLSYFNGGSWSTGVHNVAWFAPANSGANVLVAHTDGSLSYYTVSNNTWASAVNTFVRNVEGAIALIGNGSLYGIPASLYQALGNPPFAQLSDAEYNAIPMGPQLNGLASGVVSLVIGTGTNDVYYLVSYGKVFDYSQGNQSVASLPDQAPANYQGWTYKIDLVLHLNRLNLAIDREFVVSGGSDSQGLQQGRAVIDHYKRELLGLGFALNKDHPFDVTDSVWDHTPAQPPPPPPPTPTPTQWYNYTIVVSYHYNDENGIEQTGYSPPLTCQASNDLAAEYHVEAVYSQELNNETPPVEWYGRMTPVSVQRQPIVMPASSSAEGQRFALISPTTNTTAGSASSVTVAALDASGNLDSGYTGTVFFTSSDQGAGLPVSYTFTTADQGKHVFAVTLATAASQTIIATDSTGTLSGQATVQVTPAAAANFTLSAPTSTMAGSPEVATVTAMDAEGNVATGYTGTLFFTSSDQQAGLPASYTFTTADQGNHAFAVTMKTAASQTMTATDSTGTISEQATIQVTPGPMSLSQSTVTVAMATVQAGATDTVTLTTRDAFGNQQNSGGLAVAFGLGSGSGGIFSAITDNGDGTYTATFTATTVGSNTITATIGGQAITSTIPLVTVPSWATLTPAGALTVNGTGAGDTFTVGTSVFGGMAIIRNGQEIDLRPDEVTSITLNTGSGTNTINVRAIQAGVPLSIVGGGTTTVNVGNAGSVQGILGTMSIDNPTGQTTVNVDDSADSTKRAVTLSTFTPSGDVSFGSITGLAPAAINYEYADTSRLNLSTGTGGNTVNVLSTVGNVYLFGQSGDVANLNAASSGSNVFTGRATVSDLSGSGYLDEASGFAAVYAVSSGGSDVAYLYDSPGNDSFYGGPTVSYMIYGGNSSHFNQANGFAAVYAISSGGSDVALLYDSAGNDSFYGGPTVSYITYGGNSSHFTQANGFAGVNAFSSGGSDTAFLYDSAGNDSFYGGPTYGYMTYGGNSSHYIQANSFAGVNAFSSGGTDTAFLYDSAGNDTFYGAPTYSNMTYGGNSSHYTQANNFAGVNAFSSGGIDTAFLYDSSGNDNFYGEPTVSFMIYGGNSSHYTQANNFAGVNAFSSGGTDTAYLYDSAGNDNFYGAPTYGYMTYGGNSSHYIQANSFAGVNAFSSGGTDTAFLYDSAGNDTFYGAPTYSNMTYGGNSSHYTQANGFAGVNAFSSGGIDTAFLYDSPANDSFYGAPTVSYMIYGGNSSHYTQANSFAGVNAFSSGGTDSAYLYDSPGNDSFYGTPTVSYMIYGGNSSHYTQANSFAGVNAFSSGGTDAAFLYDSAGNDSFVGSGANAQLSGPGYSLSASGFGAVTATSSRGGFDTLASHSITYNLTPVGNWHFVASAKSATSASASNSGQADGAPLGDGSAEQNALEVAGTSARRRSALDTIFENLGNPS